MIRRCGGSRDLRVRCAAQASLAGVDRVVTVDHAGIVELVDALDDELVQQCVAVRPSCAARAERRLLAASLIRKDALLALMALLDLRLALSVV
jgi:hypothetical protein